MTKDDKIRQAIQLLNEALNIQAPNPTPPVDTLPPQSQWKWGDGNLWKPVSDSDGNAAVLIRRNWPRPLRVDVKRADGKWETMRYTGESNPDRWTYRASQPGGPAYAGFKKDGGVNVVYEVGYIFLPFLGKSGVRYG